MNTAEMFLTSQRPSTFVSKTLSPGQKIWGEGCVLPPNPSSNTLGGHGQGPLLCRPSSSSGTAFRLEGGSSPSGAGEAHLLTLALPGNASYTEGQCQSRTLSVSQDPGVGGWGRAEPPGTRPRGLRQLTVTLGISSHLTPRTQTSAGNRSWCQTRSPVAGVLHPRGTGSAGQPLLTRAPD